MTEQEALAILSVLKAAYPGSYKEVGKQEAYGVVRLWAAQLSDAPAELVSLAVRRLISVKKFLPTIAEVREQIAGIRAEAEQILTSRDDRKRLRARTGKGGDMPEPDKLEAMAAQICESGKGFTAEPSLFDLLQNDALTPPGLTPLGAKIQEGGDGQ